MPDFIKCTNCGSDNFAQSRFCIKCSAPIIFTANAVAIRPTKPRKSKTLSIVGSIGCGIFILGIIIIAIVGIVSKKNSSQIGSNSNNTLLANSNQQTGTTNQNSQKAPLQEKLSDKPTRKEKPTKVAGENITLTEDGIIQVSARVLGLGYEANEITADELFKGKTVEVTGKIDRIAKDILDDMYVTLKVRDYGFTSIQCYFPEREKEALIHLSPNITVTIRGKCDGKMMNVLLRNCVVQSSK